ncbi:unnamed protein product [Paramecium sonneborni]|uniref:Uncharacterized protein n=1 Tax=Paramecium sonneborni TaxID=65129 RepID=A0A8S1MP54_9CILI|nr:unnamed protein product [Paramecium sonneborni]
MSVSSLPKRGINKLITIPLKMCCPSQCACKSNQIRTWYHIKCGAPRLLTEQGDVICNCQVEFIQDVIFQCDKAKQSNTWYQHKSMSTIFIAITQSLQAAELVLGNDDLQKFSQNLMTFIVKRWKS